MFVSSVYCVGSDLCLADRSLGEVIELVPMSMCIIVCDLETSNTGRSKPNLNRGDTK
jgi:hypothetical protein